MSVIGVGVNVMKEKLTFEKYISDDSTLTQLPKHRRIIMIRFNNGGKTLHNEKLKAMLSPNRSTSCNFMLH